MTKQKIKNPLRKRIPREFRCEWRKYLVVGLFLILTVGFVSGMYVANGSMMTALEQSAEKYKLEDGHFVLKSRADDSLITQIESGEKSDVKKFYTDKAKSELDEKFTDEFENEFTEKFDAEFAEKFDSSFEEQLKSALLAQGLDETSAAAMLPAAIEQAKTGGDYQAAYDSTYKDAYKTAYDEAYKKAYDEAWDKILDEIDEKYADAEEKYELNDPDFRAVPIHIYENFFRNEDEDNDLDGKTDGTVRVYAKTDDINTACLLDGYLPESKNEVAIDRMHADNVGAKVGDKIKIGGKEFTITGLIAYVNYSTLHEKNTDFMFDALKFNAAMVTNEGFESLSAPVHYAYAWKYETAPSDEKEEKKFSDNFMKALLTQTVTGDNELSDYLPVYANQAVHFAPDDMSSDETMGGTILDVLIVIIAFIFAVTISNTITKESKTIGTLRASGYTRGELIRHYMSMPVIVTLVAAAVGNILGYTVFKNAVVSLYYNSYSLPVYETVWNPAAFLKTTLIPLTIMFVVNLLVITQKLSHTPLEFLRCNLKKNKRKKAVKLPKLKFFNRFRLRVILQNIPNYAILFFGVFFVCVMLAMAVGMPDTLNRYRDDAKNMMFADYQYVLNSYEDDDGNIIETSDGSAEKFALTSLQRKGRKMDENISVYGISESSGYVKITGLDDLSENEIYISDSFADKYNISVGGTVTLEEKYENKKYEFKVAGLYDKSLNISVFMPIKQFRKTFDMDEDEFTGYLSNTELNDISKDDTATVITERDITKMCDQLDHSMGSMMTYFQVLCIALSAVMVYLLTKIIVEKNENAISMTKILGYENGEISRLYLLSTSIVFVISDIIAVFLGNAVMSFVWRAMMAGYSGWIVFTASPLGYVKMFLFVLVSYLVVLGFDFRRIKKIPLNVALKNAE